MMYKKYVIVTMVMLWFVVSWFTNFSGAQTFKEVDMDNVWFRFCNEGTGTDQLKTDISLATEPGQSKSLCLYFFNAWDKAVDFVYWFSVGVVGKQGEKMCEADMATGNNFSKLIPFTIERKVTVQGKSYQTKQEEIKIPLGMSGAVYGCIAYKLEVPEYKGVGGMFDLVVRRTAHIDMFVWWEGMIKNAIKVYPLSGGVFTTNKKIKAEVDAQNRLKLSFLVGNQWNITQDLTITGEIHNILWFSKAFTVDPKKLIPGETHAFTTDIGILPIYKWFFTVDFTINNVPVFDFDASGLSEKIKQWWTVTESASVFIFTRIAVIILIVLVFVIYKIVAPRRVKTVKAV